ncbi:unnamed protein product [Boreogadus saida]
MATTAETSTLNRQFVMSRNNTTMVLSGQSPVTCLFKKVQYSDTMKEVQSCDAWKEVQSIEAWKELTAFLDLFTKFVSMSKERIVGEYLLLYGDKGVDLQHPSKMVVKYTATRIPKMKQKNKHFPDIVRQTPTGGRIGAQERGESQMWL